MKLAFLPMVAAVSLIAHSGVAGAQAQPPYAPGAVAPMTPVTPRENSPQESSNYALLSAIAKLSVQIAEQQKEIQELHNNIALLQIQSGGIAKSLDNNVALIHIEIAGIAKGQSNLQAAIAAGSGGGIPDSSPLWKHLNNLDAKVSLVFAHERDQGRRLLMTCVMMTYVWGVLEVHASPPGGARNIGSWTDLCTAKGWTAPSFQNFDIPFGGPPQP